MFHKILSPPFVARIALLSRKICNRSAGFYTEMPCVDQACRRAPSQPLQRRSFLIYPDRRPYPVFGSAFDRSAFISGSGSFLAYSCVCLAWALSS